MNASSFANDFTQVSYSPVMEHSHHQQYPQQQQNSTHCGYPSKHCENQRAVKRNGELHRFCEYHRQMANHNQQRRRMQHRSWSPSYARRTETPVIPASHTYMQQLCRDNSIQHSPREENTQSNSPRTSTARACECSKRLW